MATFTVNANAFRAGLGRDIEYTEVTPATGGSPEATLLVDNSNARRMLYCKWDDWQDFARWATGFPVCNTDPTLVTQNRYIARVTPWAFPSIQNSADNSFLWIQGMQRLEGVGPAGNDLGLESPNFDPSAIYQKARVTFGHSTLSYDIVPDEDCINAAGPLQGLPSDAIVNADLSCTVVRYITRWPKNADRQLTIPNGAMAFINSGTPPIQIPGVGINKKVPAGLINYTWHGVPDAGLPRKAMQLAYGTVNRYPFDGYPKGTLRVDGIDPKPVISALGDRTWDVQYTLRFEPNFDLQSATNPTPYGHNATIRNHPSLGLNYYYISSNGTDYPAPDNVTGGAGTGVPLFRYYDFANLFRPDQS